MQAVYIRIAETKLENLCEEVTFVHILIPTLLITNIVKTGKRREINICGLRENYRISLIPIQYFNIGL